LEAAVRRSHSPAPAARQLITLKDAANYIQKLPKAEQDLEEWQAAVEALLLVVELNGPTLMARIGMLRALNRHVERVFNPSRKDTHWESASRSGTREQAPKYEKPSPKVPRKIQRTEKPEAD
jgi:hypothetical protein